MKNMGFSRGMESDATVLSCGSVALSICKEWKELVSVFWVVLKCKCCL